MIQDTRALSRYGNRRSACGLPHSRESGYRLVLIACGDPLYNEPTRYSLYVVVAPCWKCSSQMKIALWEADGSEIHDYLGGPSVFGPSGLWIGISVEEGQGPYEEELAWCSRNEECVSKGSVARLYPPFASGG